VHAHVQGLVSVVKMATVLAGYITEEQALLCGFYFVGKRLATKDINK
jgi:hypothetical protein